MERVVLQVAAREERDGARWVQVLWQFNVEQRVRPWDEPRLLKMTQPRLATRLRAVLTNTEEATPELISETRKSPFLAGFNEPAPDLDALSTAEQAELRRRVLDEALGFLASAYRPEPPPPLGSRLPARLSREDFDNFLMFRDQHFWGREQYRGQQRRGGWLWGVPSAAAEEIARARLNELRRRGRLVVERYAQMDVLAKAQVDKLRDERGKHAMAWAQRQADVDLVHRAERIMLAGDPDDCQDYRINRKNFLVEADCAPAEAIGKSLPLPPVWADGPDDAVVRVRGVRPGTAPPTVRLRLAVLVAPPGYSEAELLAPTQRFFPARRVFSVGDEVADGLHAPFAGLALKLAGEHLLDGPTVDVEREEWCMRCEEWFALRKNNDVACQWLQHLGTRLHDVVDECDDEYVEVVWIVDEVTGEKTPELQTHTPTKRRGLTFKEQQLERARAFGHKWRPDDDRQRSALPIDQRHGQGTWLGKHNAETREPSPMGAGSRGSERVDWGVDWGAARVAGTRLFNALFDDAKSSVLPLVGANDRIAAAVAALRAWPVPATVFVALEAAVATANAASFAGLVNVFVATDAAEAELAPLLLTLIANAFVAHESAVAQVAAHEDFGGRTLLARVADVFVAFEAAAELTTARRPLLLVVANLFVALETAETLRRRHLQVALMRRLVNRHIKLP